MPSFIKDIKDFKKNKPLQIKILEHIDTIVANPANLGFLVGNLAGLRKYCFGSHPEYRIIFRLYDCCNAGQEAEKICPHPVADVADTDCSGLIQLLHVKTREDCNRLYKKGKADIKKSLLDDFDLTA